MTKLIDPAIQHACAHCEHAVSPGSRFCSHCGKALYLQQETTSDAKRKNLVQIALFFIIEVFLCLLSGFIDDKGISTSLTLDGLFALIAVLFFANSWEQCKNLLKWPRFATLKLLGLCLIALVVSLLVQYAVGHLNNFLFKGTNLYYLTFALHPYGKTLMVLSVALFPALFEELGYRGFLLQKLLTVVDSREAVYISSTLFFLMHFSLISIFWMIPFALFLGYVRVKTNTIWYGVFMHFCFNLMTCLYEFYELGLLSI